MMSSDHLIRADLRERGWTDALIRRFLGEPDRKYPNPHARKGASFVRLYARSRVEAAEADPAFGPAREAAARRSASASLGVEARRRNTVRRAREAAAAPLPDLTLDEVRERAIAHFNGRAALQAFDGRDVGYAHAGSDPAFLARITVNYLRHVCTPYEEALAGSRGRVGREDAYRAVRNEVLGRIARRYPELREEARAQREGI